MRRIHRKAHSISANKAALCSCPIYLFLLLPHLQYFHMTLISVLTCDQRRKSNRQAGRGILSLQACGCLLIVFYSSEKMHQFAGSLKISLESGYR